MESAAEWEEGKVESRRMVSEFFVKSLNVILAARIPAKYLETRYNQPVNQVAADPLNRSFNMLLFNPPLRHKCHLSAIEPVVVDVLLVQHHSRNTPTSSLIERWVVQCVPRRCMASVNVTRQQQEQQQQQHRNVKPPCYRSPEKNQQQQQPWKKVMRMLSLMLRSLYSLTRLLPAYRVFQQLSRTSKESPSSFDLSYKVSTTMVASEVCNDLSKFSLTPVETELGRMCVVVRYSSGASVDKAMQRQSSIFSDIIPDYVCGDANPHFAVSDTRLSPVTRTKSANIPLPAAAESKAAGASCCVRRSYSSPLQVKDDGHEELVCPFASEDEVENRESLVQGTSRDGAVGALITALRQAKPVQRSHRMFTLGNALQHLRSYSSANVHTN